MKTLGLTLYAIALGLACMFGAMASDTGDVSGIALTITAFVPMALGITLFLGISQLFLWLFAWLIVTKKDYREHREHRNWIL